MILIVVPKGLSLGIISSQILKFAEFLSHSKEVILLIEDDLLNSINIESKKLDSIGYSQTKNIKKAYEKAEWVYIRRPKLFLKYFLLRKVNNYSYKIFYDFRGLSHCESYLRNNSEIRRFIIYNLERYASKKADHLGAVSNKLGYVIRNNFKSKKPLYITPCCISDVKLKEPVMQEQVNFVYVGGLSLWQCFEDVLDAFKSVSKKIPNSTLTIITKQIESAKIKVSEAKLEKVSYKTLTHEQVLEVLPKYDFGFLLRKNIFLNNVASPVKFLEYTSNGVIPIVSSGIGDFSEEAVANKIGLVLNSEKSIIDSDNLFNLLNDPGIYKRMQKFSQQYTWDKYIGKHPLVRE